MRDGNPAVFRRACWRAGVRSFEVTIAIVIRLSNDSQ
jgi:hypothetical protein